MPLKKCDELFLESLSGMMLTLPLNVGGYAFEFRGAHGERSVADLPAKGSLIAAEALVVEVVGRAALNFRFIASETDRVAGISMSAWM